MRDRAEPPVDRFEFRGADRATPSAAVIEAIGDADRVLLAPSNPVISVGAVLATPGVAEAIRETPARVVGVSPIIGGSVVRGMADVCLAAIGVPSDAGAVGLHYGARARGGLIDAWLVDTVDAAAGSSLARSGIEAKAVPLWMTDLELSRRLAVEAVSV